MEMNVERARTRCGTAPFLDENAHRECFSWERPVGVVVLSLRSFRIRWTIELGRPRGREKSAVTRHGLALYAVSLSTRAWLIRIVLFFFFGKFGWTFTRSCVGKTKLIDLLVLLFGDSLFSDANSSIKTCQKIWQFVNSIYMRIPISFSFELYLV